MLRWHRCWILAVCLVLFGATEAGAASFGITSVTSANTTSSTGARGYRFRAEATLSVTALAMYDVNGDGVGLLDGYDVHLWTDAGALLGSVRIQPGTTSPIQSGFRFEAITPLLLSAGSIYRLSVDFGDDANNPEFLFNPSAMTTAAGFTILQSTGTATAGLTDFGVQGPNDAFPGTVSTVGHVGPNLMFDVVPEPGTGLLLVLGLVVIAASRRRVA